MTIDSHAIVHPDNRLWLSDLTRWELAVATAELEYTADAVESPESAQG